MKKAESRESTERCDGLSNGALNEYEHREKGRREGAGEEDEDTEKVGGGGGGGGFWFSCQVCSTFAKHEETDRHESQ